MVVLEGMVVMEVVVKTEKYLMAVRVNQEMVGMVGMVGMAETVGMAGTLKLSCIQMPLMFYLLLLWKTMVVLQETLVKLGRLGRLGGQHLDKSQQLTGKME